MPPSIEDASLAPPSPQPQLTDHQIVDDDGSSIYSKVEFTKQLAQSSLLSDDALPLTASQFGIRPKTLFDHEPQQPSTAPPIKHLERRQRQRQHQYPLLPPPQQQHLKQPSHDDEDEYKFLVRHLQKENEQLLIALQRSHDSLVQCRQDKMVLEDLIQDQRKVTLDQELQDWIDQPVASQPSNHSKSDMEAMVEHLEMQQARDARHRDDLLFQKRYLLLANAALESCERESLNLLQELGVTKSEPVLSPWSKCRACVWTIIAVRRFENALEHHRSTSRIKSTSSYSVY